MSLRSHQKLTGLWYLLDRAAIGLSALCIVHCVATLLLLVTFASLGTILADPIFHEIGLAVAVALAAIALAIGYARHRSTLPVVVGVAGLILMAGSLALHHGWGEFAVSLAGLALVAFAHWRNMRA